MMLGHFKELLSPLGAVRSRAMFGGHGLYLDELFIAIVIDDQLYLKVDALSEPDFARAGSHPFVYAGKQKPVQMSYWSVPEDALESPHAMRSWALLAIAAARRKPAAPKRAKGGSSRAR